LPVHGLTGHNAHKKVENHEIPEGLFENEFEWPIAHAVSSFLGTER
jgi:hypothetical protein